MLEVRMEETMSVFVEPNSRTRNFARVLGPFLTVLPAVGLARAGNMKALLEAFTADPVWSWVTGALLLMGGIAVVAFHSYWRTPAEVVVSAFGWIVILRGFLLLAFPTVFASAADRIIGVVGVWQALFAVVVLIGLYLTVVGWRSARNTKQPNPSSVNTGLPRAA
jgi:hypothetical protein